MPTPENVTGLDGAASAAAAAVRIRADGADGAVGAVGAVGAEAKLEPMNDPQSTQNMRLGRFSCSQLQHSTIVVDGGAGVCWGGAGVRWGGAGVR